MANETQITIRGNLGSDPVLHTGPNGGVVVRFTMAVSASRYIPEKGENVYGDPQWFTVKCFGALGRNVAESVRRGTPVLVRGELHTEYWKGQEGEARSAQVVRAECVAITLNGGRASYSKVVRDSALAKTVDATRPAYPDVSGLDEAVDDPGTGPAGSGGALEGGSVEYGEEHEEDHADEREERDGDREPVFAGAPAPGSPF